MSEHRTFVSRALAGEILDLEAIDDEIDRWHGASTSMSLPEWLGLSDDEYALFVEKPEALAVILMARRHDQPLREFLAMVDGPMALAARGAKPAEVESIRAWLKSTGRL